MSSSVVVTGVGHIGASGAGLAALARDLVAGTLPLRPVEGYEEFRLPECAGRAGLVEAEALGEWLSPGQARRMSPPSRMAVAAARMALKEAGVQEDEARGSETAVVLGTAYGCTTFTAKLLSQMHEEGPQSISPFLFMETVANAHAGQIALALGARGSNYTLCQREASALSAVARARELVASGRAKRVLAGTVEEIGPVLLGVLDRFGALSRSERARPFDARRDGFLPAEGSTILLLESEDDARARGARPWLKLRAAVRANDPTAGVSDWGDAGESLGHFLRARLIELDVPPDSVQRIVSGASGSRRGDRAEAAVMKACFARDLPPIVAPKSTTGEYGGAYLAAAMLAAGPFELAPPENFQPDPELDLLPSPEASHGAVERVLVSSMAAGGAAFWLVLDRP